MQCQNGIKNQSSEKQICLKKSHYDALNLLIRNSIGQKHNFVQATSNN